MALAKIGLGSNIGEPDRNVLGAIERLERSFKISARSRLYKTKAWGLRNQADFCNAVVQIETDLPPRLLLQSLKSIENEMGRVETVRWGPRLIDLDLLAYDELTIDEDGLKVPHPGMLQRAFVLAPLAEIDSKFAADLQRLSPEEQAEVALWTPEALSLASSPEI